MLCLALALQFAADETDSFDEIEEYGKEWSQMPCVVSALGTQFKRYVLEHNMAVIREDNLDLLTDRSKQVFKRINKILLQFPNCNSLVYYSTNEEILKRYITDPEIMDYLQFTSEMHTYLKKY